MSVLIIIAIALFFLTVPLYVMVYGQPSSYEHNSTVYSLFLPVPDLVYGPNTTQVIDLMYRSAEVYNSQNDSKMVVYNPDVFIDRISISNIPKEKDLKVILDSFFFLNQLSAQVIPQVSNISMNMSRILNPLEATDITQMKLTGSVMLLKVSNDTGLDTVFVIPEDIEPGEYLLDVTLFFPDYLLEAVYSTRVNIENSSMTK